MSYNSKYTGEQVESLLDIVAQGGGGGGEVVKTTEAEITAMGFTKNQGTITEVKMNGVSKGTEGVVDLGTVLTEHQDISSKQDKIEDLDAIRAGASKGATALQSIPAEYVTDPELENALRNKVSANQIATINGQSLVNGGNIVIQGGAGGGYDDTEIRQELDELSSKIDNLPQGASMTAITYADLVNLRDSGELVAGSFYRITDYETTTAQENTQSANHPFDVIVLALSENTLAEEAYAIQSERDTDGYFANSNLSAWKLWYSLDNDTERFAWADSENGKGVIYRMIDEIENDIPYDFKNILYIDMTNSKISAEASYYGNWWAGDLVRQPSSDKQVGPSSYRYAWVLTNVSGPSSNGVWYTESDSITSVDTTIYEYDGVVFYASETLRITNLIAGQMQYTFGNPLAPSSLLSEFVDYTIIGKECYSNTIKEHYNEENRQILNNITFGNNCYYNTFGNDCYSNSFGNYCYSNTFGNYCDSNSFGNYCDSNTLGNYCYSNTLGNNCDSNTFGNYCDSNTLGNFCYSNTFGNNCYYNTFGNNCYYNSFGNYCDSNSFGNYCDSNSFGDSSQSNELRAFYRYIAFGKGVQSVILENDNEGDDENKVQNYRVANGTNNQVVNVARGNTAEYTIATNSEGELKVFCLADLIA